MNYKVKLIRTVPVLVITSSVFISGCLKDKAYDKGEIQSVRTIGSVPKVVELKTNAADAANIYTVAFPISGNDTTVNFIPVNLATVAAADKDIHVTLIQNDQLITDYNTANATNGANYSAPSPSLVQIVNPGGLVVIPKGAHTGYLQIKYKTSDLAGKQYALGFTIKSIAESDYLISGNEQNALGILLAKNKYDGVYITKGSFIHPIYSSTWTFDDKVYETLNTSGTNSVVGKTLNTLLAEFAVKLEISVNADNTLNIVLNGSPTPPSPDNRYDPATKSFFVKGSSRSGSRTLLDTLTFLHPK